MSENDLNAENQDLKDAGITPGESFVIDDDFDPLEDIDLENYDTEGDADYLMPIPDADKSVVPPKVILPPEQRIAKLIEGMPGQMFRLLGAVEVCKEPKTIDEASAALEETFPQGVSVFDAPQIIRLLTEAGALDKIEPEGEDAGEEGQGAVAGASVAAEAAEDAPEAAAGVGAEAAAAGVGAAAAEDVPEASGEAEYLEYAPAPQATYVATEAGLAAVAARTGTAPVVELVTSQPKYLDIYKRILTMCSAEGGANLKDLNAEIDPDPVLTEPRLFCTYFLNKLENAGGLVFRGAWKITSAGKDVLASDVFAA